MIQNTQQRKYIAPGILLIKYIPNDSVNKDSYVFEIKVQLLNIVEFECDFTGSQNITIKDTSGLKCLKTIEPFKTSVVAILQLHKDWKLKSKFKFTLKSPPKQMQAQWVLTQNKTIRSYIVNAETIFKGTQPSLMPIEQINSLLEKADSKFLDLEFIPDDMSIIGKQDRTLMDSTVTQWRPPEMFLKMPFELIAKIHPNNLVIGKLNDESFFSVLRCLAMRPPLIERLFLSPLQVNERGVYRLRICKNGQWQSVTIDDSIPCEPISHPKFTRSIQNDLWPMLIEKAYAKLHRSYFSLRQLQVREVFEDLTGCPTQIHKIQDTPQFNHLLAQNFAQGYIVSFYNVDQIKEFEEDSFIPISKRAYPLTKFKEGQSQIGILAQSGQIYLTLKQIKQKFMYLCLCKTKNWEEIRVKGKFMNVQHAIYPDQLNPVSKYYYTIDVQITSEITMKLHQQDIHIGCNKHFKPYNWISLVVFKKISEVGLKKVGLLHFANSRQITLNITLEEGAYVVVPVILSELQPTEKMEEQQFVYDIFRQLDLLMTRELKYAELVPFFKAVRHPFNQQQYINILKKYSKNKYLGPKGFARMWKDHRNVWLPQITEMSQTRLFILSMHCARELSVLIKNNIGTDLDNLAHIQIISAFGKEKNYGKEGKQPKQAKIFWLKHPQVIEKFRNSYITYYVENDYVTKIEVELDCSQSTGYTFNPPSGKVTRQLDSGQREFVMKMIPQLGGDLNFTQKQTVNIKQLE